MEVIYPSIEMYPEIRTTESQPKFSFFYKKSVYSAPRRPYFTKFTDFKWFKEIWKKCPTFTKKLKEICNFIMKTCPKTSLLSYKFVLNFSLFRPNLSYILAKTCPNLLTKCNAKWQKNWLGGVHLFTNTVISTKPTGL